ncbi:MAG: DUF2513 domain-containing protein [Anaerolineales bacterium]|nr:DUF2513 domain-containing protein [Anaerolineales bacterium]
MKRDMDLVRRILLAVEESQDPTVSYLELDGWSRAEIGYHMELLVEAGYLLGTVTHSKNGPAHYYVQRLTWDGHEFLDLARNQTVWKEAKTSFMEKGAGLSLDVLKAVLVEFTKRLLLP